MIDVAGSPAGGAEDAMCEAAGRPCEPYTGSRNRGAAEFGPRGCARSALVEPSSEAFSRLVLPAVAELARQRVVPLLDGGVVSL